MKSDQFFKPNKKFSFKGFRISREFLGTAVRHTSQSAALHTPPTTIRRSVINNRQGGWEHNYFGGQSFWVTPISVWLMGLICAGGFHANWRPRKSVDPLSALAIIELADYGLFNQLISIIKFSSRLFFRAGNSQRAYSARHIFRYLRRRDAAELLCFPTYGLLPLWWQIRQNYIRHIRRWNFNGSNGKIYRGVALWAIDSTVLRVSELSFTNSIWAVSFN